MKRPAENESGSQQHSGSISLQTDDLSDEALISAIAGGAVWAMEPLYQRYSRILYSLKARTGTNGCQRIVNHHYRFVAYQSAFVLSSSHQ